MSRIASWLYALALVVIPLRVAAAPVPILLDADTPATGSNLDAAPLVTPYGAITFVGEIRGRSDPDFILAGAVGDVFVRGHRTGRVQVEALVDEELHPLRRQAADHELREFG